MPSGLRIDISHVYHMETIHLLNLKLLKLKLKGATGTQVCSTTIRRRLWEFGLKGCITVRKPLHPQAYKQKRLEWCRDEKDWTSEQWAKMLFSDKSIFELIPGRRTVVRRRVGERYHSDCIVSTAKNGGGKIQVWGCMAASGFGNLKVVNGRVDASAYVRLICCTLEKDGKKLCGRDFIFQQDRAPCHRANRTKSWFEMKRISVRPWSSQSPDLNPIEHLWEVIKKSETRPCKNLEEFKVDIFVSWDSIDASVTVNLVSSIPQRCVEVIAARCGSTKY